MSKLLIFEGIDGSGKTTLINNYNNFLCKEGYKTSIISKDLNIITQKLIYPFVGIKITPEAEICARLAIEFEKLFEINKKDADYYLCDRSILTIISIIHLLEIDYLIFKEIINSLYNKLEPCGLVFTSLPFIKAQERVLSRDGFVNEVECNENLQMYLKESYQHFFLNKTLLDTFSMSTNDCVLKIHEFSKLISDR